MRERPRRRVFRVPFPRNCFERIDRWQAIRDALLRRATQSRLAARFLCLLAREAQAGIGIGAEAQCVAPAIQAVVEAPSLRATFDEEPKVQASAIGQAMARIAGLELVWFLRKFLQCDLRTGETSLDLSGQEKSPRALIL